MQFEPDTGYRRSTSLVDVLDRVLDKGLVIAGDIKISLAEVELITIRIRLIVCSADKAEALGLDWWRFDRHLSGRNGSPSLEEDELREQVRALERKVEELSASPKGPPKGPTRRKKKPKGGSATED